MQTFSAHIVIVGGGAAGMCAALGARQENERTKTDNK